MNTFRTSLLAAALVAAMGVTAAVASDDDGTRRASQSAVTTEVGAARVVLRDQDGDVANSKLDIQKVRVTNGKDELKVRVYFPGVAKSGDFPTGAISVFLDTDRTRSGAEYGHFMDFFSEYRFAEVSKWREQFVAGGAVAESELRTDKDRKLRWYEFVVSKAGDNFNADAVRVAVSTINTGDLEPTVTYEPAYEDHLGERHSWSAWIPVTR